MYVCIYIYMYVCIYIYMYVYIYICMYIYIYILNIKHAPTETYTSSNICIYIVKHKHKELTRLINQFIFGTIFTMTVK